MQNSLVSVIIPSFNYALFIEDTLESLRNQAYTNLEIIVIDDGSTDHTSAVVEKYRLLDDRIKYIFQENKGLPAARNTGLKIAKGKYIQFLDADDLLSKDKILHQVLFMDQNPNVQITYTTAKYFKHPDIETLYLDYKLKNREWMPRLEGNNFVILGKLIKANIMPVNSALMNSSLLKSVGLQNETLKSLEDWEYWIRCAYQSVYFKFINHKDAFALIRVHEVSMSKQKNKMLFWEQKVRAQINIAVTKLTTITNKELDFLLNLNRNRLKKVDVLLCLNNDDNVTPQIIYTKYGLLTYLKLKTKIIINNFKKV